jgi:hypothetical protein
LSTLDSGCSSTDGAGRCADPRPRPVTGPGACEDGTMTVPDDLERLLRGFPAVGADEQAFPFLTVDDNGFPHPALLSRAELEPGGGGILAVIASPNTRANLQRDGRATLIAVHGTTAHYAKLRMARSWTADDLLGCEFHVSHHKRDSLGIPLAPIGFHTTAEIAEHEHWVRTAALLRRLQHGFPEDPD